MIFFISFILKHLSLVTQNRIVVHLIMKYMAFPYFQNGRGAGKDRIIEGHTSNFSLYKCIPLQWVVLWLSHHNGNLHMWNGHMGDNLPIGEI